MIATKIKSDTYGRYYWYSDDVTKSTTIIRLCGVLRPPMACSLNLSTCYFAVSERHYPRRRQRIRVEVLILKQAFTENASGLAVLCTVPEVCSPEPQPARGLVQDATNPSGSGQGCW